MIKIKNIFVWLGVLLTYLLAQLVMPALLNAFDITNDYATNICLVISDILIVTALIIFYLNDFKNDYKNFDKSFKEKIAITIRYWLIGLLIMVVSNNIIGLFTSGIAENESVNRVVLNELTIYAIPTMVIFGPICEEIIFRLSFKKIFSNKLLFIILSGLVFGGVHIIGASGAELFYIIPYGTLGAALASIYVKNKNILYPILAHMLHNFICVLIIMVL